MKAALIDNQNSVINVICWDDTCTAPEGTFAVVVEDDVSVAADWVYADGTFIAPATPSSPKRALHNYQLFWELLLASNVYGSIRTQAMTSLALNTLVTEFIVLLSDAKAKRPNTTAIQASMDAILTTGTFVENDLEELLTILTEANLDSIYTLGGLP